jgi:hypothetical protein
LPTSCSRGFDPRERPQRREEPLELNGAQLEQLPPEARADLVDLAQYILRNPFSVGKMTMESPTDNVIYRSRLNAKINRNFEVFTPTDFLAAITQQIPDKDAQMVRHYGWYSNKTRGVRQRGLPTELVVRRPGVSPTPRVKLPSRRWRDLILRVSEEPARVLGQGRLEQKLPVDAAFWS